MWEKSSPDGRSQQIDRLVHFSRLRDWRRARIDGKGAPFLLASSYCAFHMVFGPPAVLLNMLQVDGLFSGRSVGPTTLRYPVTLLGRYWEYLPHAWALTQEHFLPRYLSSTMVDRYFTQLPTISSQTAGNLFSTSRASIQFSRQIDTRPTFICSTPSKPWILLSSR